MSINNAVREIKVLNTVMSANRVDARKRVLSLYRDYLKQANYFMGMYALEDIGEPRIRERINEEFKRHKNETDLQSIDMLLFKGRQSYEELMNQWKQRPHVVKYFHEEVDPHAQALKVKKGTTFLDKFYSGTE